MAHSAPHCYRQSHLRKRAQHLRALIGTAVAFERPAVYFGSCRISTPIAVGFDWSASDSPSQKESYRGCWGRIGIFPLDQPEFFRDGPIRVIVSRDREKHNRVE
jgi:hypothetical protein